MLCAFIGLGSADRAAAGQSNYCAAVKDVRYPKYNRTLSILLGHCGVPLADTESKLGRLLSHCMSKSH